MRRSSSIIARRTHSSSISRQAQMLPITSSTVVPQPLPSPGIRSPSTKTPGTPSSEKVKEWVDIFDGPMRPAVFVPPTSTSPPSSAPIGETDNGINSIIFDGPARPRYIIPGARIHSQTFSTQNHSRNESGSPSTTQRRDVSELLSRSSLPPPRIYDGPAFEWELQSKRV